MPLLRRYLTCFYCGSASNQKYTTSLQEWRCKVCEAVNHLDENGEITDPPASQTHLAVNYAQNAPRASSPELAPPENDLFCATCIKNQELHRRALASYLPAPDDPKYDAFEAAYDEYRKNLDARYPQMCANCAPRVQERIRNSTYAAKTDALRRIMEKSRQTHHKTSISLSWRVLVVRIGGLVWWTSIAVQILWHVITALASIDHDLRLIVMPTIRDCASQMIIDRSMPSYCILSASEYVQKGLFGALATIWWNNKLAEKTGGRSLRLTGLQEHIKLQIVALTGRVAAWWFLKDPDAFSTNENAYRGFNVVAAAVLFVYVIVSMNLVRIEQGPGIRLNQSVEPYLPQPPMDQPEQVSAGIMNIDSQSLVPNKSFPVSKLAPLKIERRVPPVPKIEPNSFIKSNSAMLEQTNPEDEMEWSPTKPVTFSPASQIGQTSAFSNPGSMYQPSRNPSRPSPFYGALPPAPTNPAQRLRNPPNQHIFSRGPTGEQTNMFRKFNDARTEAVQQRYQDDDDDSSTVAGTPGPKIRRDWELSSPKLRWNENAVDTGLESLFDSVFSIKDEIPREVEANVQQNAGDRGNRSETLAAARMLAIWSTPLIVGALAIFMRQIYLRDPFATETAREL